MNDQVKMEIVIVTYNRRPLLQKTIEGIWERTKTPYEIIVIDNNSTVDDTKEYLKKLSDEGKITAVFNKENIGLAPGYNVGLDYIKNDLFVTANDDLVVPDLDPDWIQRMVELFNKHYPEYGSISMRCARLKNVYFNDKGRIDFLPHDEIGEASSAAPALFRLQKKSDILKHPSRFGTQGGYRDELQFKKLMKILGMRSGFSRDIWCNHIGYALDNRGYPKGFDDYAGKSELRNSKNKALGYPEIDKKTNKPLGKKY